MTAVDDRPDRRDRPGAQAQGGPAADHRPHPLDRQHPAARACCTSPWCAAPSPTPRSPRSTPAAAKAAPGRRRRRHRRGPRGRAGRHRQRLADHRRPDDADATCRSPSTTSPAPARSSPSSSPAPQPRRATPPSWSTSTTTSCPPVLDLKEAAADDGARPPRPRHQQVAPSGSSTPPRRAPAATSTRPSPRRATDGIVIEREYRQQRLIPAFMEPRSTVVDPTGEQMTMWSATQIPHILRFLHRRDDRASPSPRSGSSRPTSAAASAASCRPPPRSSSPSPSPAGSASRCKYTETRSESLLSGHHGRDQWQKLTLAADEGRHGHRPQGRAARRHGRLPRPRRRRRAGARRVDVQLDLQVPGLPVHLHQTCSPTRPGSTPTAAPAGPRRRTPSSG